VREFSRVWVDTVGGEFVGMLATYEEEISCLINAEGAWGMFCRENANRGELTGFWVNFETSNRALLGGAIGAFAVIPIGEIDELPVGCEADICSRSTFLRKAFRESA